MMTDEKPDAFLKLVPQSKGRKRLFKIPMSAEALRFFESKGMPKVREGDILSETRAMQWLSNNLLRVLAENVSPRAR